MPDYFSECYAGPFREQSPEDFRQNICRLCRNPDCVNTGWRQNPWVKRMTTQVERLLENPTFADPRDPQYDAVRKVDFKDALRSAIRLEISAQRGDWEIPTAEDAVQFVETMKRRGPGNPVQVGAPEPVTEPVTPPSDLVDEVQVRPAREQPKLPKMPARFTAAEQKPAPPNPPSPAPQVPAEPIPKTRSPHARVGPEAANFRPPALNTAMPEGGIMIGDEPSPSNPTQAHDPWAPSTPAPKERVIPVGGKIVLGEDPPEGER